MLYIAELIALVIKKPNGQVLNFDVVNRVS